MLKTQLRAYGLAVILGLTLLTIKSAKPLRVEGRTKTDFSRIPMEIGGWTGRNGRFDDSTYEVLSSCSLLVRFYERQDSPPIDLAIVYGTDLGDFHQPEMCLEGQGLRLVNKRKITITADKDVFHAVSLLTEGDFDRRAFIYWFAGKGRTSSFLGNYKVEVLFQRLRVKKIQPNALIRFSTEVIDSDQEAVDRLVGFIKSAYPYLKLEIEAAPETRR